jgi:hypothetical protein
LERRSSASDTSSWNSPAHIFDRLSFRHGCIGGTFAYPPIAALHLNSEDIMRGCFMHAVLVALACLAGGSVISAGDPVDAAADLIGRPYVWGAEGPNSFDCSGLTHYVFARHAGIELPRRAINQADAGDPAGKRLRRGDLVFFATNPGSSHITHVGIYEGGGKMINATSRHGEVRREDLNDEYWTQRFVRARRILGSVEPDTGTIEVRREPEPTPRTSGRSSRRGEIVRRVAGEVLRRVLR